LSVCVKGAFKIVFGSDILKHFERLEIPPLKIIIFSVVNAGFLTLNNLYFQGEYLTSLVLPVKWYFPRKIGKCIRSSVIVITL